jgi:hypothetical protein
VDQDIPHRAWNGKVCTSARAAWELTWADRAGESAITTETTTLMSAGTEVAAAEQ